MKKIIREVDEKKGIVQVTIADERWYIKTVENEITGIPEFKFVPSSTWIAGCYPKGVHYYKWLAEHGWDEAEAIKKSAGEKGTKVHKAIEAIMRGEEVRVDSKFTNPTTEKEEELSLEECDGILGFLNWFKETKPKAIAWEVTVFSEKHNFAGTVDFICQIGDEFWIIDFKTSQYIWKSHEIQVSGYRETIVNGENTFQGLPKDLSNLKLGILQVGLKRNKSGYKFTEIPNKFDLFLTAQEIWQEEHAGEQPNKKDYPIILSPGTKPEDITFEQTEISVEEALGEQPAQEEEGQTKRTKSKK